MSPAQVRFGHGRPRLGQTDGERPPPVGRGAGGAACGPLDVDRQARRRRRVDRTVQRRGRVSVRFAASVAVDEDGGGGGERGRLRGRRTVFRQRHATAFAGGAVACRAAGAVRRPGRRLPSDAVRPPGDGRGGRHARPPGRPAPVAGRGGVAARQDGPGHGPMVSGPVGRHARGQAPGRSGRWRSARWPPGRRSRPPSVGLRLDDRGRARLRFLCVHRAVVHGRLLDNGPVRRYRR